MTGIEVAGHDFHAEPLQRSRVDGGWSYMRMAYDFDQVHIVCTTAFFRGCGKRLEPILWCHTFVPERTRHVLGID